jgi:tetratricopeptide (TPR) repeat protein
MLSEGTRHSNPHPSVSLLAGMASFGLYLCTLCPTVYVGDSGELTAAAHTLGIAHNSGYPLYALLGKIFCLIPFGTIGFRMNLMSATLSALTVGLLHDLMFRMTRSAVASSVAAFFLAFTSLFWFQSVAAEVYAFHLSFVTLILWILGWWDQKREFRRLALLSFVVGLSFCNHLQTVMLAPAVFFLILNRERAILFQPRNLALLCSLLLLALTVYVYLPLRTEAGAAITWGDPNTLDRFLNHVLAKAHRSGYVLNVSGWGYLQRAWEAASELGGQFSLLLPLALWGWISLKTEWRAFYLLVAVFDLFYTVFLNTISIQITPFGLSTALVLTVLSAVGIHDLLRRIKSSQHVGARLKKATGIAFTLIPLIPLTVNIGLCNQSRNYTAYEYAVNILGSAEKRSVLFIDGDNHVFPVIYARMCEAIGEDTRIIDRFNLVFRWPRLIDGEPHPDTSLKSVVEALIQEQKGTGVYLSTFDPHSFPLPAGHRQIPYGVVTKVENGGAVIPMQRVRRLWGGYSVVSFYEPMKRDYMNRQVCAYFHFHLARFFFESGSPANGLGSARSASNIGYDDELIHSDLGILLTQRGFYEEALRELEMAFRFVTDVSIAHNNMGVFHDAFGEKEKAILSFEKAIALSPRNTIYLNNLGFALLKGGRAEEAVPVFSRSLNLNGEQPRIRGFVQEDTTSKDSGKDLPKPR